MAKDIVIAGATFNGVPSIEIPTAQGGTARYTDTSGTTATAEDVAEGKVFYNAYGAETTGTASGGSATLVTKSITGNGTYNAQDDSADGYSQVTVNVSGGGHVASKDVDFIDYDGTILYSYTAAEFAGLTEMPPNPTHTGLTAQGWNWNLTDAKTHVAAYGQLVIGQMYVTDDGKTHLYISIPELDTPLALPMQVRFKSSYSKNCRIDWGDGTVETKGSSSGADFSHTYAAGGDYVITLEVTSGTISFVGAQGSSNILGTNSDANSYKQGWFKKLEIGANVTILGQAALQSCYALESVTIPSGVSIEGGHTFTGCSILSAVVVPANGANFGNNTLNQCSLLRAVSLPYGLTSIKQNTFADDGGLKRVTIPSSVTSIANSAFSNCRALTYAGLPSGVSGTLANSAFLGAQILRSVVIPDGVTAIGNNVLQNCRSLSTVTIPANVRSIGTYGLSYCYSMREIHFKSATPPTVSNANAFYNLPTTCKIYVPTGSLSAYTSASNYPNSATYTYIEE